MKTLEEALAIVLGSAAPLPPEQIPLENAAGRFMAEEIRADLALPPFHQSAMDGYAVRAAEAASGNPLRVAGQQAAGQAGPLRLGIGEAIRIFTGARIPEGADAVVMQEDAIREGENVHFSEAPEVGEFIRRMGEEVCVGQALASRGDKITAALAGLLAAQGRTHVSSGRPPRVAVLSTGDELCPRGLALLPGQIYESNGILLRMLAAQLGCEATDLGTARDDAGGLAEKLASGFSHDVLVISGGVSVGDRDLVKSQLRALGAEQHLWRVALKPGKPFLFATRGECLIFGLPGNPVSSFVTWLLLVRPALLQVMGARECSLPSISATMEGDARNTGDRPEFVRGTVCAGRFKPVGRQESHALFGLSKANALLRIDPGEHVQNGQLVSVLWFQ